MALKAYYDKKEDVPAHVAEDYVERNGRFELAVDLGLAEAKTFTDFSNLNSALTKERGDHKVTKARFALLGDRKLEDVIAAADRVPELEAQVEAGGGKIDEKKMNDLVESRIKVRLAPIERERDQFKAQLGEKDKEIDGFKTANRTRTIRDAVREAATKAQILPGAIEDAIMLGERVLEITDDGKVVTKDGAGVTPGLLADVWLTDLQKTRAHWWGNSTGGGAGGARGGVDAVKNPWSREHWNMTQQSMIYKENRQKAEQLATQAGTTIGGKMPEARK